MPYRHGTDGNSAERSLFEEAVSAVQSTLSEHHQQSFQYYTDANSLISALEDLCQKDGSEDRRLVACKDKFELFALSFEGYFEMLSFCVEISPEWQLRLWGLLQLVFQVSTDPQHVTQTVLSKIAGEQLRSLPRKGCRHTGNHCACTAAVPATLRCWQGRTAL
jgi:hypothetical protein